MNGESEEEAMDGSNS